MARSTFYRYRQSDEEFDKAVRKAQRIGRAVTCDAAESRILNLMNSNNEAIALKASKLILNTYNHRYQNNNASINYQKAVLRNEIKRERKEKMEVLDSFDAFFTMARDNIDVNKKSSKEQKLIKLKNIIEDLYKRIRDVSEDDSFNEKEDLRDLI